MRGRFNCSRRPCTNTRRRPPEISSRVVSTIRRPPSFSAAVPACASPVDGRAPDVGWSVSSPIGQFRGLIRSLARRGGLLTRPCPPPASGRELDLLPPFAATSTSQHHPLTTSNFILAHHHVDAKEEAGGRGGGRASSASVRRERRGRGVSLGFTSLNQLRACRPAWRRIESARRKLWIRCALAQACH